jgi:hypothetical protein
MGSNVSGMLLLLPLLLRLLLRYGTHTLLYYLRQSTGHSASLLLVLQLLCHSFVLECIVLPQHIYLRCYATGCFAALCPRLFSALGLGWVR